MKKKSTGLLFITPFILFFMLFWLIPFIYGIVMSLSKYSLIMGNQGFVGFSNYTKILVGDSMYHNSFLLGLKNTVIFTACTTPFLVLGSLGLALLLDRLPDKCKGIFRTIYFASYSVSVTAVAAVFVWLMKGNGGYLNNLMMNIGIIKKAVPWMEQQPFVWVSLTVATVWWTMTTIIASFNVYGQPRLMTKGGPGESTKPVIMVITSTIMDRNDLGIGSAMTLLMGIVIVICSIGQYFLTKEKEELR